MELPTQLQQLGLTDKQAQIYLAVLSLGSGTVLEIARCAGVKRPTTYVILEELQRNDLVTTIKKGKALHFQAVAPAALQQRLQKQLMIFDTIQPYLDSLYQKDTDFTQIRTYRGVTEINAAYEMFHVEHSQIDFFSADIAGLEAHLPAVFALRTQHPRDVVLFQREVLSDNPVNQAYAQKYSNASHPIQLLPTGIESFGDCAMANDTIIFTNYQRFEAVVLQSPSFLQTFRGFFALAWEAAAPPTKNVPHGTFLT